MNRLKKSFLLLSSLVGLGFTYDVLSESYVFTRNIRTIKTGLHILWSYKIAFNRDNYLQIHESVAKDIYQTCIRNDGLYVKFGQGIATMDHLLPPPFYKHLSKLQDQAKAVSIEKVKQLFSKQVGKSVQQTFKSFEEVPVASASIAQVHRAVLKNGMKVAVKIQKPNISKQFKSDMMMHYLINFVLEKAFDLPFIHFVDDIQRNLKKELDFRIEAENSKKGYKNFQILKRSEMYVPEVIDQFTRERVLVSEWIDGFKITEETKLKELGFNKKKIMNKLIRAFAEQIFVSGFIHCDPHPGNVFIRPNPSNPKQPQIVLLDFGLCIQISEQFRKKYSTFWKSMFLQDIQTIKNICQEWGMPYSKQFVSMQIMRPYSEKKLVSKKVEKKDIIEAQHELKDKMRYLMKQSINFPKELIFIGRNMNLVRSLNKYYGAVADRISIMAKAAYFGSQFDNFKYEKITFSYIFSSFRFTLGIWLLQFMNWISNIRNGKSIDEIMNYQAHKKSQKMFEQYGFKPITDRTYSTQPVLITIYLQVIFINIIFIPVYQYYFFNSLTQYIEGITYSA